MKEYRTKILRRARTELFTGLGFGAATIATLLWPTWIESLTRFEPDGGNGESEWWLVGILAIAAVASAVLSAFTYRVHRRAIAS